MAAYQRPDKSGLAGRRVRRPESGERRQRAAESRWPAQRVLDGHGDDVGDVAAGGRRDGRVGGGGGRPQARYGHGDRNGNLMKKIWVNYAGEHNALK